MNAFQRCDGRFQGRSAAQQCPAKLFSGDFNFLGEANFLLSREQRDFGHLTEIHPDGVVTQLGQRLCFARIRELIFNLLQFFWRWINFTRP